MAYKKKPASLPASLAGRLYSPTEASQYLGVALQTLAHWRVRGSGPKFIHLSKRCVRYSEMALREFVEQRTRAATCETNRQG